MKDVEEEKNNKGKNKNKQDNNNNNNSNGSNGKSGKKKTKSTGCGLFYLTPQNFQELAGLCLDKKWTEINTTTHNTFTTKQIKSLLIEISLSQPWKDNEETNNEENNLFKEEVQILLWCAKTLVKTPCFEVVNVNPINNEITSTEGLVNLLIDSLEQYVSNKEILAIIINQTPGIFSFFS